MIMKQERHIVQFIFALFLVLSCVGIPLPADATSPLMEPGQSNGRIIVEDFVFFDAPKHREHLKQAIPAALELRFSQDSSLPSIIPKSDLWKTARDTPVWQRAIKDRSRLVYDQELYVHPDIRADFVVSGEIISKGGNEFALIARLSKYRPASGDFPPIGVPVEVRAPLPNLVPQIDLMAAQLVRQIKDAQITEGSVGHVQVFRLCAPPGSKAAFFVPELEDYIALRLDRVASMKASLAPRSDGRDEDRGSPNARACPNVSDIVKQVFDENRERSSVFISGELDQSSSQPGAFKFKLSMAIIGVNPSEDRNVRTFNTLLRWPPLEGDFFHLRKDVVDVLLKALDNALLENGIWDINAVRKNLAGILSPRGLPPPLAEIAKLNDEFRFDEALNRLGRVQQRIFGKPILAAAVKGEIKEHRDNMLAAGLLFEYSRAYTEMYLTGDFGALDLGQSPVQALRYLDALDALFEHDGGRSAEADMIYGRMYLGWGKFLRARLKLADDRGANAVELLKTGLMHADELEARIVSGGAAGQVDQRLPKFKEAVLDARKAIARELRRDGKHEEAGKYFRQLVELEPARKSNWTGLINNLVDQKKPDVALIVWRQASAHASFKDSNVELVYPRRLIAQAGVAAAIGNKDVQGALEEIESYRKDIEADVYYTSVAADTMFRSAILGREIENFASDTGGRNCSNWAENENTSLLEMPKPHLCAYIEYKIRTLKRLRKIPRTEHALAVTNMDMSEALLLTNQWYRARDNAVRLMREYRDLKLTDKSKGSGAPDLPRHYSRILSYHRFLAELLLDGDVDGARRAFNHEVRETDYKTGRTWNNSHTKKYLTIVLASDDDKAKGKWSLIDELSKEVEKN